MQEYLQSSANIHWQHAAIRQQAARLAAGCSSEQQIAANCYYFVRDTIRLSWDFKQGPVTYKASEVMARYQS